MTHSADGPGGVVDLDDEQVRMLQTLDLLTGRAVRVLDRQVVPAEQLAALGSAVARLVDARVRVLGMRGRGRP